MNAHGIGKGTRKQVIVTPGYSRKHIGKCIPFLLIELTYGFNVSTVREDWDMVICESMEQPESIRYSTHGGFQKAKLPTKEQAPPNDH